MVYDKLWFMMKTMVYENYGFIYNKTHENYGL